ncbi:solute carrier family 22 member 15-like isoform X2 [Ciona intestinalis]
MDVDDCYAKVVGKFGRYQIFIYAVLAIYGLALPSLTMMVMFINAKFSDIETLQVINSRVKNDSSIILEWDLEDKVWISDLIQSLYFAGFLFGVLIFGQISDKIGRKKTMILGYHILLPISITTAFSTNYIMFAVLRTITGLLVGGSSLVMFIYTQELVSRERWALTASGGSVQFSLGCLLLIVFTYFIPPWRKLYIAASIAQVVPLIFTWFVPESPRWLYSKGRLSEAEDVLVKIAKRNGVKDPVVSLAKKASYITDASYSIVDIFKYKSTMKRLLVMAYNWCGRKRGLTFCLCASGLFCFGLMAFKPGVKNALKLSIGLGGKMAISAAFSIIYIYSPELFPTIVRNVSLGSLSMIARVGGILAAFSKTSVETSPVAAYLTFGLTGVTSGLFTLMLRETLGTNPPDSFEDLEKEERKRKSVRMKTVKKRLDLFFRKKDTNTEEAELLVESQEEDEL